MDDHLRKNKVTGESEECEEEGDDICSGSFDTIAHIRNELFVFVKTKLWRFSDRGILRWVKTPVGRVESETGCRRGYPAPGRQMFGFTRDIERFGERREESVTMFVCRIDAVYERLTDGAILFFSGRKYWRSDGNHITGKADLLTSVTTINQHLGQILGLVTSQTSGSTPTLLKSTPCLCGERTRKLISSPEISTGGKESVGLSS